ncbi:MAG TPA: hypothetical protein VMW65_06525 [Chloroflexota bacterium]|nr:hypothetical protein [Chloroflexota bacterium]
MMAGRRKFLAALAALPAFGLRERTIVFAESRAAPELPAPDFAVASAPAALANGRFVDGGGQPLFLLGVNYEGPADRAWQMWNDGKFDPGLIGGDFDRAKSANLSVIRVFVQTGLAVDIQKGNWSKLDQVLALADQRGLKLILTFGDYTQFQLADLVAVETAVAAHYPGRATIFAFDLKNEPHFGDLALSEYPAGTPVALQDAALVSQVGQSVARQDIAAYRSTGPGKDTIPTRLSDDQAYVYANVYAAYLRFLSAADSWASAHHRTVVDYYLSADSAAFNPLKNALDDSYAAWLDPQLSGIRGIDSSRLITVGQVDPIIASLSANNWLDYRTLHRYPTASPIGIAAAMKLFDAVKGVLPKKPLVLGEFGFSNATLPVQQTATLEAQVVSAVRDHGGAGALKWMLNDFPAGFNAREDNLGMYDGNGTAKPVVAAFQALGRIVPVIPAVPSRPMDYAISGGHFYTQASGMAPGRDGSGFAITNAEGIPFWDAFQRLGGVPALGYPASGRFVQAGFVVQATQKAILQWQPATHQVALVNVFDQLHDLGEDGWLASARQTPAPFSTSADTGQQWPAVVARHLALLNANRAIKARFLAEPDWLDRFGLPMAVADYPNVSVVRAQRAVLQQWKVNVPWAKTGQITIANGGDVAKEGGLVTPLAMVPEPGVG